MGKTYGDAVSIKKLGWYTSSLLINGQIHIINGDNNDDNVYMIYSMETRKATEFKYNLQSPRLGGVCFTKRADDSEFYKFGGCDVPLKHVDSFSMYHNVIVILGCW